MQRLHIGGQIPKHQFSIKKKDSCNMDLCVDGVIFPTNPKIGYRHRLEN